MTCAAPSSPAFRDRSFGARARSARERIGASTYDISRISGVSRSAVTLIENGYRLGRPETRHAILQALQGLTRALTLREVQ